MRLGIAYAKPRQPVRVWPLPVKAESSWARPPPPMGAGSLTRPKNASTTAGSTSMISVGTTRAVRVFGRNTSRFQNKTS